MNQPKIGGIDEAGKGSVLGPMVIAAVAAESQEELKALGVQDSKRLSPSRRREIYSQITETFQYAVVIRNAEEIDHLRESMTMNELVARAHAEALDAIAPETIYLDACDVIAERYGETVRSFSHAGNTRIIAEHKADSRYPVVSAASIVAKVTRDACIDELATEWGEIGSGYPADPITIAYLSEYIRTNRAPPAIARKSWATVKSLIAGLNQKSLFEF